MSETVHTTSYEQPILSDAEAQRFTALIEQFHLGSDSQLIEDSQACMQLNEELSRSDLQADRISELRLAREELLSEFLERPRDAFVAEVLNYARLCEGRSLTTIDASGTVTTEFVTSDHVNGRKDLHIRISQMPSGAALITTEVPLKGDQYDQPEPFYITASSDGSFSIEQKVWRRGQYEYVPLPLDDERATDRLTRFFSFSTEAVHLAYTRQPEQRLAADNKAKYYLLAEKHDLSPNAER